ncbi:MAG: type I-E CRISPR-associated protein Cas6/Cse3/CasE [Xanthomonadaceae bacterium]|nr:type I-E CRISPR-associated protein Cas6/Cse3/CasE [Xanthomonadaceae bacterium]MDP2184457.1 type I-E CRISPR-associated protein Cas6/Cse3/CasE [Xanthomonadales bacterium]MDZ4114570.1 type I-E CRISPR-associated protein Cas6/Cse3/CasE [Xanthomonadaceae bacterium]MDZ4377983.1 type I-E CRISPR-associated protein Cas6/Cse3/CasE [Xanthomonadaceae bacterium]
MFISRVEIPWEAARNPYDIHRQLWRLFPGEEREIRPSGEQVRQGFLFRVEEHGTGRPATLLVQSRRAPVPADGPLLIGSREIQPAPRTGQRLAFVLTANPVKTVVDAQSVDKPDKLDRHAKKLAKRPEKKPHLPKCRVPLIKEDEQRIWLARKLTGAATLESAEILPHSPLYFRKGKRGGKLVACTFEGVLRVDDCERLTGLLENGVGPAKAFGCGLLLVRRA